MMAAQADTVGFAKAEQSAKGFQLLGRENGSHRQCAWCVQYPVPNVHRVSRPHPPAHSLRYINRGARTGKQVDHGVAGIGEEPQQVFQYLRLGGMAISPEQLDG